MYKQLRRPPRHNDSDTTRRARNSEQARHDEAPATLRSDEEQAEDHKRAEEQQQSREERLLQLRAKRTGNDQQPLSRIGRPRQRSAQRRMHLHGPLGKAWASRRPTATPTSAHHTRWGAALRRGVGNPRLTCSGDNAPTSSCVDGKASGNPRKRSIPDTARSIPAGPPAAPAASCIDPPMGGARRICG